MSITVGIEELQVCPVGPKRPLPTLSLSFLEAIRFHGPIAPVVVRKVADRQYEILSNIETWLAVQRVGQLTVPIEIRPSVTDAEAADIIRIAEKQRGRDPIEEAEELERQLQTLGGRRQWGAINRLVEITGLGRSYITHALRLLELPTEVQTLIRQGQLSVGHAKPLVRIKRRSVLNDIVNKIIKNGLSVRQAELLAREAKQQEKTNSAPSADVGDTSNFGEQTPNADIRRLEHKLSDLLGCASEVDTKTGYLKLHYAKDLDVLDGLLKRLGYAE